MKGDIGMVQSTKQERTRGHFTADTHKSTWHYPYIFVWSLSQQNKDIGIVSCNKPRVILLCANEYYFWAKSMDHMQWIYKQSNMCHREIIIKCKFQQDLIQGSEHHLSVLNTVSWHKQLIIVFCVNNLCTFGYIITQHWLRKKTWDSTVGT